MEVAVFYNLILGVTFGVFHLLDFEATSPATFMWKELHKDTNTTKRDLWKPFQKMSSIYQGIFRIYQGLLFPGQNFLLPGCCSSLASLQEIVLATREEDERLASRGTTIIA